MWVLVLVTNGVYDMSLDRGKGLRMGSLKSSCRNIYHAYLSAVALSTCILIIVLLRHVVLFAD